jgi:hypothetical protein
VAQSSVEAEYRATTSTTTKLIWIKQLFTDLGIKTQESIKMYCDNQAAHHITSNLVFHERTIHIKMDYHFIREKIHSKEVEILFVRSKDQSADVFTNGLEPRMFNDNMIKLEMIDIYTPNLRGSVEN